MKTNQNTTTPHDIVVITLHEHNIARCGDIEIKKSRGSVIDVIARKLIDEEGCDPSSLVEIYRYGTLCFKRRSLGAWAKYTVHDPDNGSLRVVNYKPHPKK